MNETQPTDEEILKHRAEQYGDASESFGAIAQMWSAYLGTKVNSRDVAMMMVLLKVNRSKTAGGFHFKDSCADGRNYLTLAEQLHELENDN